MKTTCCAAFRRTAISRMAVLRPLSLATLLLLLGWSTAHACMMGRPFNFLTFGKTDMVRSARIRSYRVVEVPSKQPDHAAKFGVFMFEAVPRQRNNALIDSGLTGPFTAYWRNSTFQFPDKWRGPTNIVVGLEVEALPDGKLAIFIAEEGCSPPAIVPDTAENREKIYAARNAISSLLRRCPAIDPETGAPPTDPDCQ